MQRKIRLLVSLIGLLMMAIVGGESALAQHAHEHTSDPSWKKGMVRLTETASVGALRLPSGMYHVRHIVEGDKHWLVFKEVAVRAGYQEGFMWEGKEVARVECRVAPTEKSVRTTKVVLTKNERAAASIQEIQIAGEKVRHILMTN
ncbi:MAG: hypothetical protein C5B46_02470 [Proteobacteria bacterium]|nr:MAG: hypothetical protein C5B46_02470 [Pseudomonadota bacterium]